VQSVGIGGHSGKDNRSGKTQLLRALTPVLVYASRALMMYCYKQLHGDHLAPGNFCRIIDLDIIVFFESVSRAACVFESRADIFLKSAPDFSRANVDPTGTRKESRNDDRNGRRDASNENCVCVFLRCFRYVSGTSLHRVRGRI
jgi:hypothetical protein